MALKGNLMCLPLLRRVLLVLGLSSFYVCTAASPGATQQLSARSGPLTAALLELYTSEGCNSCPPADEWVNALAKKGFALDRVVPLGFHVDYWDNLGWPDRFAQAIFTKRQREIAARQRSKTIYTPQLVLQGQSLTHWESFGAEVQRINQAKAKADLRLTVTKQPTQALSLLAQAHVTDAAEQHQAKMYIALYENHLTSDVKAGENKGRTLRHNYVVRQWLEPLEVDGVGSARLERTLTLPSTWKMPDMGIAVFVQQPHTGVVLQALALPLGP